MRQAAAHTPEEKIHWIVRFISSPAFLLMVCFLPVIITVESTIKGAWVMTDGNVIMVVGFLGIVEVFLGMAVVIKANFVTKSIVYLAEAMSILSYTLGIIFATIAVTHEAKEIDRTIVMALVAHYIAYIFSYGGKLAFFATPYMQLRKLRLQKEGFVVQARTKVMKRDIDIVTKILDEDDKVSNKEAEDNARSWVLSMSSIGEAQLAEQVANVPQLGPAPLLLPTPPVQAAPVVSQPVLAATSTTVIRPFTTPAVATTPTPPVQAAPVVVNTPEPTPVAVPVVKPVVVTPPAPPVQAAPVVVNTPEPTPVAVPVVKPVVVTPPAPPVQATPTVAKVKASTPASKAVPPVPLKMDIVRQLAQKNPIIDEPCGQCLVCRIDVEGKKKTCGDACKKNLSRLRQEGLVADAN